MEPMFVFFTFSSALEDQMEGGDMAPKFLTRFYDQTLTEGVPTEFQCMITGRPEPAVMWLFNNSKLSASADIEMRKTSDSCCLRINEVLSNAVDRLN